MAPVDAADDGDAAGEEPLAPGPERSHRLARLAMVLAAGWLGTNLGLAVVDLPLRFVLKDQLRLPAEVISRFFAIGQFSNYIKPAAGAMTDSVPFLGTRRRHYLLWSLFLTGALWMLLSAVPRQFGWMLTTYTLMYAMVMVTSTTLGGVMVEVGTRFRAAGRLTAQRVAMFRLGSLGGGPIGGFLANFPFFVAAGVCAALHWALLPLVYTAIREPVQVRARPEAWRDAGRQLRELFGHRILMVAALMAFLLAASPGFHTPLLFYQTDTLHLNKQAVGNLILVQAATGFVGAMLYHSACQRFTLRWLVAGSIVIHAAGTLFYLGYHSWNSALAVTAGAGVTGTLAMLPVYDLAARATPRGSEALGYSLMMSVWNLTNALSDWVGSALYSRLGLTFMNLIWLNAGTTILVLIAVPFLPAALMLRREGAAPGGQP